MKYLLFITTLFILPICGQTQARLILNNNVFVNLKNDAYLVVDNNNSNAITTSGSGGNILSEKETNVLKWNIANATGNYVVPYTNTNNVKIPLELNITNAGSANGSFLLSTYRTSNMNAPWPADVNNMNSIYIAGNDASLFVIDRFWKIDCGTYTTKPGSTINFSYDYNNEGTGSNTIAEPALRAQRYNSSANDWELVMFGAANTTTKKVNGVIVEPTAFHKTWTLVDQSTPLPITLLNFEADCKNRKTILNWSTASENNNDYFEVEKSTDGSNFSRIAIIQGAGNSNSKINYSYTDIQANTSISYYRLKQVDFNGKQEVFPTISSDCLSDENFNVNQVVFDENSLQLNVQTTTKENLTISLYDLSGRLIAIQKEIVTLGYNPILINNLNIIKGIYILNIEGEFNHFTSKIYKQ